MRQLLNAINEHIRVCLVFSCICVVVKKTIFGLREQSFLSNLHFSYLSISMESDFISFSIDCLSSLIVFSNVALSNFLFAITS